MLLLSLISLFYSIAAVDVSNSEIGTAVIPRIKRQQSFSVYYLCGTFPNQFISARPCNNNCNNCNNQCNTRLCSNNNFCRQFNSRWTCQNGCCRVSNNQVTQPVCGGREVSGGFCQSGRRCGAGFLCTSNNVCCRCATGTSVGPCVNRQCPNNYQCNQNNECCPFQVGK